MTSLFSRARTKSTPQKSHSFNTNGNGVGNADEFGRVPSRGPVLGTPSKKDKKEQKRSKTTPSGREEQFLPEAQQFPDGAFLPLNLERPKRGDPASPLPVELPSKEHDYGYLSYERHVVLGVEQLERLVEVVSEELETRGGLATPFIFSNTALDISSTAIKRLIRTFLNTCQLYTGHKAQEAETKWREEARFAGPHELGMCLRWGLARVIRSVAGQDVRGLITWEHYLEFRETEAAVGYPSTHFATQFLPTLIPPLQAIIVRLLSLLTRLIANSTATGHTPPTLSPLFAPLFFGLGPATLTFHHAYIHYLRAANAMEHLILAFIRWQDSPRVGDGGAGSATTLGVPVRLKEWIKGYPATLPVLDNKKPQPRRGARTIRLMSVRRNVRMYSPDLVKTAATWAHKVPGTTNTLASSKEWDKIAPSTLKLPPRYSEAYKKKMSMPANFHPDTAPGAASSISSASTLSTAPSSIRSTHPDSDYFGLGNREGDDRFRSLTDMKWGEFEDLGFSNLGNDKKLQFDLTEGARTERAAKRQTLSWNDFSSDGFSRMDAPLSATLEFSTPLATTISSWPTQNAEMTKKLKKAHKTLPAFGWDTEPVVGSEEVIEDAFVDVFCDLIYGGGWMDLERGEALDRDCNWALVEYKSLPPNRTTTSGGTDPRTASTLILFEEFVPLEYREQLAVRTSSRRRLPSLFSSSSRRPWKQAPTLNGRPYIVGHVPLAPSPREVEFEGLLHGNNSTRILSLNPKSSASRIQAAPVSGPPPPLPSLKIPGKSAGDSAAQPRPPKSDELHSDSTASPSLKKSLFKANRKSMVPAEYSTVEFQTRMASYSDDDTNAERDESEAKKQKRRESSADAWVDILVGTQDRMPDQDAEMPGTKKRGLARRSDPDIASQEVAQVLAAVQNRSPSPPSVADRVDRDYGMDHHFDQHISDTDVVEVETVPRTSNARSIDTESDVPIPYDESDSAFAGDLDTTPDVEENTATMNARQLARHQRRVGYFDIHPERRNAQTQSIVDDPRDKLANDSDADDDDDIYGPPDGVRPLPNVPSAIPKPVIHEPSPHVPGKSTVQTLNRSSEVANAPQPASTPSKTAALIEMYRQRELSTPPKGAAPPVIPSLPAGGLLPVAPLAPSRLPVRTAKDGPTPETKVSPKPLTPEPDPIALDVPRIPLAETGRDSPGRYVHGAPLHNVVEEEEEE